MQKIINYIIATVIILAVADYMANSWSGKVTEKTNTSYSAGKTAETYKQGNDSVSVKITTVRDSAVLKPTGKDSSYSYTKSGNSYNLNIKVKPITDDKFSLKYFLKVKAKKLLRVDTLFRMRVDTVKITKTIVKKVTQPFYNTFIFGAIVTGSIILLLLHILN